MFTCSSCGYEANPDSAPACSLCGTKKPGAGGSAVRTAPKPAGDDELADVAKAVADSADTAPAQASARGSAKAAKAASKGGGAIATETSTGILRLRQEPPEITNPATMLGAFVGSLVGYIFAWSHAGHAPTFSDLLPVLGGAIIMALVGRFALASMLEMRLDFAGREAFAGPVSGLVGVGFLLLTIVGFWQGGKVGAVDPAAESQAAGTVDREGRALAEHVALLTPWTVKIKNEKHVVFSRAGSPSLDIPNGKLTAESVREIQKALGVPGTELDRLSSDEPCQPSMALPDNFSVDRFIEQIGPLYGVQKDSVSKPVPGKILLTRRKSSGGDDKLSMTESPRTVGDLLTATPKGVRPWVAVALGLPAHPGAPTEHDQFVAEIVEKYGPTN